MFLSKCLPLRLLSFAIPVIAFLNGCAGRPVKQMTPIVSPTLSIREQMTAHMIGTWEAPGEKGKMKSAVFDAAGGVTFKDGLETYNPGRWSLDGSGRELTLTFPSARLEDMQIFQMYLRKGVKAFAPYQRQATYDVAPDQWTLNIAGWEYTKRDDSSTAPSLAEPTFK